jgi:hypothetical protein
MSVSETTASAKYGIKQANRGQCSTLDVRRWTQDRVEHRSDLSQPTRVAVVNLTGSYLRPIEDSEPLWAHNMPVARVGPTQAKVARQQGLCRWWSRRTRSLGHVC